MDDLIGSQSRPPLLIGDHPALDFLNTRASPEGVEVEWLGDGRALAAWLAAGLGVHTDAPGPMPAGIAGEARAFREWFRGFVAARAGRRLDAGALRALDPLNALLAEDAAYRQVGAAGAGLVWTSPARRAPAQALLQPIAAAAGDLVCGADFSRVRQCEGAGCTLWFLDRTKSGGRRWCSMAVCGNRAKAAGHRARRRQTNAAADQLSSSESQ